MGVISTNVSLFKIIDTLLHKPQPRSILKRGSRLKIKLIEHKLYHLRRKVLAEASTLFDDHERQILSFHGEVNGQ